ncbi:hypothetical protein PAHAL_5G479200 [Panicum hallii]|jgi:hypothetical protein|uniref:Uncharacterized protein n=1 Tax=Panicum hallii TaxID=206008 RepID=A0A2T8INR0_9POAL|nr:hypothetical protein PAHAL_5G479200 [Panicum hallii]
MEQSARFRAYPFQRFLLLDGGSICRCKNVIWNTPWDVLALMDASCITMRQPFFAL